MGKESRRCTLLFINKDSTSQSLSNSQAIEKTQILSHVQNIRWQNVKSKPEVLLAATAPAASQAQVVEISTRAADMAKPFAQQHSFPCMTPSGNATDPFSATSVGQEVHINHILELGINRMAKPSCLANAYAPAKVAQQRTRMRHDHAVTERLRLCVSDKTLMYASLAVSSSRILWLSGRFDVPPDVFVGRALPAVRERIARLNGPADTPLLLSVYALALTELWHGVDGILPLALHGIARHNAARREACRMHLAALRDLIQTVGAGKVEPYVLEGAILGDKYLALAEGVPPLLCLDWDPGPDPPKGPGEYWTLDRDLLPLGGAFFQSSVYSHALLSIIQDLVSYIQIAKLSWCQPVMTAKKESWLFLRLNALIYRLLQLDDLSRLEDCVRHTILVFILTTTEYSGAQIAAIPVLGRLKTAVIELRAQEQQSHEPDREILFWILSTAALATMPTSERKWFRLEALAAAHAAGIELTVHAFQTVLERYLYLADRQTCNLSGFIDSMSRCLTQSLQEPV